MDPKDGELCLDRVKPEETLVEARSGSDVQIDRQPFYKEYRKELTYESLFKKTNSPTRSGVSD